MKHNQSSREAGFTIFELVFVILILVVLASFFIIQRNGLEKANRDQERKTAINAMYYALKDGFYKNHGYYPRTISRDQLTTMDPKLFTDPSGYTLEGDKCTYANDKDEQKTDGKCEYRYQATDCDNEGKCKAFSLTADLETESDYHKNSSDK